MGARLWAALLTTAFIASGCFGSGPGTDPGSTTPPPRYEDGNVTLRKLVEGLESPVYITHAGDASGRLFVLEQAGRIRVIHNGSLLSTPYLDITSKVGSGGERGLLGLAFDPAFKTNGRVFVYYTAKGSPQFDSILARYVANPPGAATIDVGSEEVLLRQEQPFSNHNGGMIAFGPDGYLYLGLGDGGAADDPFNNAQSLQTLLGKILRLDVNTSSGYRIPAGNPFQNSPGAKPEIWAYGLRNPWRFSFDSQSGDLFMGDVGQNQWEEVNRQPAASKGGENYGWKVYEGNSPYRPGVVGIPGTTFPIAVYATSNPNCSVTGGYVYRGPGLAHLQGVYVFGDYCSGHVFALKSESSQWVMSTLMKSAKRISSFGQGPAGELYLVDHEGTIQQLVAGSS
jgi:glucose/arabinose dehydrogenase